MQVHVVVYIDLYAYSAIIWRSNHASNGHLQEGRNNEKFLERLIVAVAYERWSLTIGSDYRTLTGKSLVFGEVVA